MTDDDRQLCIKPVISESLTEGKTEGMCKEAPQPVHSPRYTADEQVIYIISRQKFGNFGIKYYLCGKNFYVMKTTTIQITVPNTDLSMLKKLINGMGWTMSVFSKSKKSGIEKGLEDIKNGNVYRAENSADLVKQILG